MHPAARLASLVAFFPLLLGGAAPVAAQDTTALMTRRADGKPVGDVGRPSVSGDGRYFVYTTAEPVVLRDLNESKDAYLFDRQTQSVELVSVDLGGAAAGGVGQLSMSTDGRFIVYTSEADDIVDGDTNGENDLFLRDRLLGTTERVNLTSSGGEANDFCGWPVVSGDGQVVAFSSTASNLVPGDTNGEWDVFVRDRVAGTTERVSVSNAGVQGEDVSVVPGLSDDGRIVSFESNATKLVPGDTNGGRDIFYHDRSTGTTHRASVASDGVQANDCSISSAVSGDGDWIVFVSRATNLDPNTVAPHQGIFLHRISTGETKQVYSAPYDAAFCTFSSSAQYPAISGDGSYVSYYAATTDPETSGVFRIETASGALERVDVDCLGRSKHLTSSLTSISDDGAFVAFVSSYPGLWPTLEAQTGFRGYLRGPGLPCADLSGSPGKLSAQLGGVQTLELTAGRQHGHHAYQLLGSTSGTFPGIGIDDFLLLLNAEGPGSYFALTATHPNEPPLAMSLGTLDEIGRATAEFEVPAGIGAAWVGTTFHHAFVVFEPGGRSLRAVSTPLAVTVVP